MELIVRDRLVMSLQSKEFQLLSAWICQTAFMSNKFAGIIGSMDKCSRRCPWSDSVSHCRLQDKLRAYGIHGRLLNWIVEFLRSTKMRVRVRNDFSDWMDDWTF